jgi:hypothetical protein
MLTANPRTWYSWDYTLVSDGVPVADIETSSWRETGHFTASGATYSMFRERLFWGVFLLETDGTVLARAKKPSAFGRRFVIDVGGAQWELKPRSAFSRSFRLLQGGVEVGRLSAIGFLSRRINVELSESLPLPIKAFVVWLIVLLWKRDSNAVVAGGT